MVTTSKPATTPFMLLADKIRARIENGELVSGIKLDSVRTLARKEGLSPQTVAKAIDHLVGTGHLTTSSRRGVYVKIQSQAVGLRNQQIGLFLNSPLRSHSDSIHVPMLAMQNAIIGQGGRVLTATCIDPSKKIKPRRFLAPSRMPREGLQGIIGVCIYSLPYLRQLADFGIPVVAYDVDASPVQVDSVSLDDAWAACAMTRRLQERGCRRIAYVGGPLDMGSCFLPRVFDPAATLREEGYRLAIETGTTDLPLRISAVKDGRGGETFRKAMESLLAEHPDTDGILVEELAVAAEVVRAHGKAESIQLAGWMSKAQELPRARGLAARFVERELSDASVEALLQRMANPGAPLIRRRIRPEISEL